MVFLFIFIRDRFIGHFLIPLDYSQQPINLFTNLGMMVLDQRPIRAKPNNVFIIEELDLEILKQSLYDAFNQ